MTNTFDTYDAVGNKEDLENVVRNVSPTETPFISMVNQVKVTSTNHEFQTDALAAAAANAKIEGDDLTASAITATTRLGNRTQIMNKVFLVTASQDAMNSAGRDKELTYQKVKHAQELKRDMEYNIVGVNNAKVTGNATTARELASVQAWITTNTSKASDGTDPTGDGTDARTDGTQRALTEAMVKTVLKECFTEGGSPDCILVGPFNKQVISGFGANATRFNEAESKKAFAAVHFYDSDFGVLKIIPNRFSRERDALILDKNYWSIGKFRPMTEKRLAESGFYEKWAIETEITLVSGNEKASGIVADLTTS